MIKIKEYSIGKRGARGAVLSLPKLFLDDNNVQPGDTMEMYREKVEGKDALILIPRSKDFQRTTENLQPAV